MSTQVKYLEKRGRSMCLEGLQLAKNPRNEKPSHSTKHVTDSLLQDELDTTTHEKQISDDVMNPFDFK
jgi:hypothetical protein